MDFFQVTATGTKTSGASTPGDWSDANCYGSIQTALNQTDDGDHVILDDDDFVVSSDIVSTSLAFDGTVTIRSRSGDRTRCSLKSSSASVGVFRTLNTTNIQDFIIEDINLGKTVTHTGATAAPIWQAAQQTGHIHLRRCGLVNVTYASTRNGAGGLIAQASAASGGRYLILEDCVIEDINFSSTNSTNYIASMNPDNGFRVIGTLTIRRVQASGINFGGIYCRGPIDVQGEIIAEDVEIDANGSNVAILIQTDDSDSCFIEKISGTDVRATYESARAVLLDMNGPHTVNRIEGTRCVANASDGTAGLGGIYVAAGNAAVADIGTIVATDCHANYGAAAYFSQGASGEIDRVIADGNVVQMGVIYKGGWGDVTVWAYEATNNRHPVAEASLATEAQRGGLILYGQNQSSATRASTLAVYNLTEKGNVSALPLIHGRNNTATYAFTLELYNAIAFHDAAKQIVISAGSGETVNLKLRNCGIRGGEAAIDSTTWNDGTLSDDYSGTITADPELGADLLPANDAYHEAGVAVPFLGRLDTRGRYFGNPPSIGCREARINRQRAA